MISCQHQFYGGRSGADCVFGNYVPAEIKAQSAAIAKSGRQMLYSLSPGVSDLAKAREVAPYANMYRLTDDVWDSGPGKASVAAALADAEFVTRAGLAGAGGLRGKRPGLVLVFASGVV
jgi:hypothetical protein